MRNKTTLVVNLFGVPSSGKSTGASYIFSQLKLKGVNAEIITEFAKDKVWEDNTEALSNQAYVFGEQSFRQSKVDGKVDVIITDSPLLLSILYNKDEVLGNSFNQTVLNVFNSYNNVNFLLLRSKPYDPNGRIHTEEESNALKEPLINLLGDCKATYKVVNGDEYGYQEIINDILRMLNINK